MINISCMYKFRIIIVAALLFVISDFVFAQTKQRMEEEDGYVWFKVSESNLVGAEDANGKTIIPTEFREIQYVTFKAFGYFVVLKEFAGVYSTEGECLFHFDRYDRVIVMPSNSKKEVDYYLVQLDGKYGLCDKNGIEVIPTKYDTPVVKIGDLNEGIYYSVQKKGKYGICAEDGTELIGPEYDTPVVKMGDSKEGRYYSVQKKGKYGICAEDGTELIAPEYDTHVVKMGTLEEGLYYSVQKNGKYGICDEDGSELIPPKYDIQVYKLGNINSGFYFSAVLNGKEGAFDESGKEIVPLEYESLIYSQNIFKYKDVNGNYVAIDGTKNIIKSMNLEITKNRKISEKGFVWYKMSQNGFYGAESEDGDIIVPMKYDSIYFVEKGDKRECYFVVKKDGFEGRYSIYGDCIFEPNRYHHISKVGNSEKGFYYVVEEDGKKGLCNVNGQVLIRTEFDNVFRLGNIDDGYYHKVEIADLEGIYDINGHEIIKPIYNKIIKLGNKDDGYYYMVEKVGKKGIVDIKGHQIISPKYDEIYRLGSADKGQYYNVILNDKEGVVDIKGKMLVEPKYAEVYYSNNYGFCYVENDETTPLGIDIKGRAIKNHKNRVVNDAHNRQLSKSERKARRSERWDKALDIITAISNAVYQTANVINTVNAVQNGTPVPVYNPNYTTTPSYGGLTKEQIQKQINRYEKIKSDLENQIANDDSGVNNTIRYKQIQELNDKIAALEREKVYAPN